MAAEEHEGSPLPVPLASSRAAMIFFVPRDTAGAKVHSAASASSRSSRRRSSRSRSAAVLSGVAESLSQALLPPLLGAEAPAGAEGSDEELLFLRREMLGIHVAPSSSASSFLAAAVSAAAARARMPSSPSA